MLRLVLALVLAAAATARAEEPPPTPPAVVAPAPDPAPAPVPAPPPPAPKPDAYAPQPAVPEESAGGVEIRQGGGPQPRDLGPPGLLLGPNVSVRYPYAWAAGGAFVEALAPGMFTLNGQVQYGFATSTAPNGDWGQLFWEGYVGYPFQWRGTSTIHFTIETKNEGDVLVKSFTKVDVVTHSAFVLEAGAQSGRESFSRLVEAVDATTGQVRPWALPFDRRLVSLAAGVRYLRSYNSEMGRGYDNARSANAIYARALVAAIGAPAGVFHVGRHPSGGRVTPQNVGFEIGGRWDVLADFPAPLDFAAGWLPGGLGLYLSAGLSLPVWVL